MHLTSHITHSNGYAPCIAYYRSNGVDQLFRKLKPKPKLNPPNAHRSQIKICENRQTQNVQFPFMPNAFRILKPIQKSSKDAFECFVTQVQTRLPKTKCVWPMKINVICTVHRTLWLEWIWPVVSETLISNETKPTKRSQIKISEKRQTWNVQFRYMPNAFKFLSQFRKVRNVFECFVTQVQTRLPKTKRVCPLKINVICTVCHQTFIFNIFQLLKYTNVAWQIGKFVYMYGWMHNVNIHIECQNAHFKLSDYDLKWTHLEQNIKK